MNHYILLGIICSFLLFLNTGAVLADEVTTYIGTIQGGEVSIMNESDGMMLITVRDVIPYFYFADGGKGSFIPINQLATISPPLNAALLFSRKDTISTSMVTVTNLSLSDENTILKLQVNSLKYYDGEKLNGFANSAKDLAENVNSEINNVVMYFEYAYRQENIGCLCGLPCPPYYNFCCIPDYCDTHRDLHECCCAYNLC